MAERPGSIRRKSTAPVQLTAGPMKYDWIMPSLDSTKVFSIAVQVRAHLVQYDSKTKLFIPYLSGLSATDLAFSPDGKWIAYVSVPEGTLWRSRADGTDRLQLTTPPIMAVLPVWTPDGSQLVFNSYTEGQGWKALAISAQGGAAQEFFPAGHGGVDFNWSTDGEQIVFSSGPEYSPMNIRVFDPATKQIKAFPDCLAPAFRRTASIWRHCHATPTS